MRFRYITNYLFIFAICIWAVLPFENVFAQDCRILVWQFDDNYIELAGMPQPWSEIKYMTWANKSGTQFNVTWRNGESMTYGLRQPAANLKYVGFRCGSDGAAYINIRDCDTKEYLYNVLVSDKSRKVFQGHPTNKNGSVIVPCNCKPPKTYTVIYEKQGYQPKLGEISFTGKKLDLYTVCLDKQPPPPPPTHPCSKFEGVWDFKWGTLKMKREGDIIYGSYQDGKSEVWGKCKDNVLAAYWVEPSSNKKCSKLSPSYGAFPKKKTYHWGLMRIELDSSGDAFIAKWNYCEEDPSKDLENGGTRLVQPATTKLDSDGGKYSGELAGGKRHGKGTYEYPNGNRYEGLWQRGAKHGKGTFTWANGNEYVGEYREDKKMGRGTLFFASGNRYEGQWENNVPTGGRFIWADGRQSEWSYQDEDGKWVHSQKLAKGGVSFVLTWEHTGDKEPAGPDIDIWVTDPNGNKLSSERRSLMGPTSEGGSVDLDDEGGYAESGDEASGSGPERVFWPRGKSPFGTYTFGCKYAEGSGSARCKIDIYVNGKRYGSVSDSVNPEKKVSRTWTFELK